MSLSYKNRAQKCVTVFFFLSILSLWSCALFTLGKVTIRLCTGTYGIGLKEVIPWAQNLIKGKYSSVIIKDGETINIAKTMSNDLKDIPGRTLLINYHGLLQKILCKNYIHDIVKDKPVYRLKNGALIIADDETDISIPAENLIRLKNSVTESNIPFIYIQIPNKINKHNSLLPAGAVDNANTNADHLLEKLMSSHVETLDLREELHNSQYDYQSLFYKSDGHWRLEAGLWAAGVIAEKLIKDYGFEINPSLVDPANFKKTIKKRWFLGAPGLRVGTFYVQPDNITVLSPLFQTKYKRLSLDKDSGREVSEIGDFDHLILDLDTMNEDKGCWKNSPFLKYTGHYDYKSCENLLAPNNKRILICGDSFSLALNPFLSLCCRELIQVDLRDTKRDPDVSLLQYIKETKPDIVIVAYYTGMLNFGYGLIPFTFD